ncbi:MAG TPA: glycoside hydrolase [Arachidicoccus sp.]|nr:glycoside hydrolase [Arachidicoccus sp.]
MAFFYNIRRIMMKRSLGNRLKRSGIIVVSLLLGESMFAGGVKTIGQPGRHDGQADTIRITINPGHVYQKIHSFGASDCWSAKFIGQWKNEQKKNKIADWLFSMDTLENGSPKGIGLTLWRFNIGGGSFEQGDSSNIKDPWRREACFMNPDGSYDWGKQKGQQWFLRAARKRGLPFTLGFSLTPPVFMTRNGKAYNSFADGHMNIRSSAVDSLAAFLARVARHFKFDFLSPVNEPQWEWGKAHGASQEGTQAVNPEIAALVRSVSPKLSGSGTKLVVGEAGQWQYLYGSNDKNSGDQIRQFFSPESANYIGGLPSVVRAISGHGYFTTCPDSLATQVRSRLWQKIQQTDPSLAVWQTEFGILGDICHQYTGSPRNTGMDYGLYVAKVIHDDLTIAGVSSWQWWLAMSPYNYSDALVYINDPSGKINVSGCEKDGVVLDSKQLWVLGNFSRFIRPGMERIDAKPSANGLLKGLLVSAYRAADSKKAVVVVVNSGDKDKTIRMEGLAGKTRSLYTTSSSVNLDHSIARSNTIKIPAKSVVTVVGRYH